MVLKQNLKMQVTVGLGGAAVLADNSIYTGQHAADLKHAHMLRKNLTAQSKLQWNLDSELSSSTDPRVY